MPNIPQIKVSNTVYDLVDKQVRLDSCNYKGSVGSGTNLNSFTDTGFYRVESANKDSISNMPVNKIGDLFVYNGDGFIVQRYLASPSGIYTRYRFTNQTWNAWFSDGGSKDQLAANNDLNDIITDGNYRIATADVSSMTHRPAGVEGKPALLIAFSADNSVAQIYIAYSKAPFFRSRLTDGTWSNWKTFSMDRGVIDEDTDLDNIDEDGNYRFSQAAAADSAHIPEGTAGILTVKNVADALTQEYVTYEGHTFARYRTTGESWSGWQFLSTDRGVITAAADLNDLTDSGCYRIANSAVSGSEHMPEGTAGVLSVKYVDGAVVQEYVTVNDILYLRYRTTGGEWSAWANYSKIHGYIPENTDFNDLTDEGVYRITTADASSADNMPIKIAGMLNVLAFNGAAVQEFTDYENNTYTRYKPGSGAWTPWKVTAKVSMAQTERLENALPAVLHATVRPCFQAHQGAKDTAPANTMPAYQIACENAIDGVQIAVARQSLDGTWYVIHDDDISLTTNGTGNLSELSDSYIATVHVNRGTNVGESTDEELRIPKLEDVLALCVSYGVYASIRLGSLPTDRSTAAHAASIDSFFEIINKFDAEKMIFSGSNGQIAIVKGISSRLPCQVYYDEATTSEVNGFIETCVERNYSNMSFLADADYLTASKIQTLHSHGIVVAGYTDTSDPEDIDPYVKAGIDIIQTAGITYSMYKATL